MPERKTRRKRYRRRRRRYRKKKLSLQKSPVPTKMFTKLKYVEGFTIDPVGPTTAVQVYSANGCYDPNISGGGHQPRGFDQLMTMYGHYVVLGAKLTVSIAPHDNLGPVAVGVTTLAGNTVFTNKNDYLESPNTIWRTQGLSASNSTTVLTKYFSTKKFLGRSNVLSDSQLKGSSAGNPEEQAFFHVWAAGIDGVINPAPLVGTAEIEYLVALIEPLTPSQS